MYGFLCYALENLVIRSYGKEKWKEVIEKAGVDLEGDTIRLRTSYPDGLLSKLIQAASQELDMEVSTLLCKFGEEFFRWCVEFGYDSVLRSMGRNLEDFLCNLDSLHHYLASEYPGMQSPSFHCSRNEDGSLTLDYFSKRKGLQNVVVGIVSSIAANLYNTPVKICTVAEFNDIPTLGFVYHAVLEISYVDVEKSPGQRLPPITIDELCPEQSDPTFIENLLPPCLFDKLFPFHVVFDQALVIKQCGAALRKVVPLLSSKKRYKFTDLFILVRPPVGLSFNLFVEHPDCVYVVQSKPGVVARPPCSVDFDSHEKSEHTCTLYLNGQMILVKEHGFILYLCSPRATSVAGLAASGLYLSDIALHDAARDCIFKSGLNSAEQNVFQELEAKTYELEVAQKELQEEKSKTDGLIHSILPETVAKQLRNGEKVDAEKFSVVTILFSDIKGFTNICASCEPIQVVELLNDMYTLFDSQLAKNNVYKVETIGDAYMVVGGLPVPCESHAVHVANQALDMMECVKGVKHPQTQREGDVEIRVGIHSGEAMAGVVGVKMPRYCLFGNTVNVASRTESNGIEGKINVSVSAYQYLKDCANFSLTSRGFVEMKGVKDGGMVCYFLESATGAEARADKLVVPVDKPVSLIEQWSRAASVKKQKKNVKYNSKGLSVFNLEAPSHIRTRLTKPLRPIKGELSIPELGPVSPVHILPSTINLVPCLPPTGRSNTQVGTPSHSKRSKKGRLSLSVASNKVTSKRLVTRRQTLTVDDCKPHSVRSQNRSFSEDGVLAGSCLSVNGGAMSSPSVTRPAGAVRHGSISHTLIPPLGNSRSGMASGFHSSTSSSPSLSPLLPSAVDLETTAFFSQNGK